MSFAVVNPASGQTVDEIPAWDEAQVEQALEQAAQLNPFWQGLGYAERSEKARVHVKAEERVVVKGLTGQHRILIIDE